jgi:3'-phosphoadenosine 5'-phosphosulfate (PAPS) 3'-phosphatase
MQDDDALAEIFAFLALKAGAAIMRVRASGARARIKSDSSPVCDADLLAEEIILEGLVRLAPRFPIVAEELPKSMAAHFSWSILSTAPGSFWRGATVSRSISP